MVMVPLVNVAESFGLRRTRLDIGANIRVAAQ